MAQALGYTMWMELGVVLEPAMVGRSRSLTQASSCWRRWDTVVRQATVRNHLQLWKLWCPHSLQEEILQLRGRLQGMFRRLYLLCPRS